VTFLFALFSIITSIPIFKTILGADIAFSYKLMLCCLNTLPLFDIIAVALMS
jgi:hypothetical protein